MVGVLALQGAVSEHISVLRRLGAAVKEVRLAEHLVGVNGLIVPGGESTTLGKLMERFGLQEAIRGKASQGMAIWGTCAGMILLGTEIEGGMVGQRGLSLLPVTVRRNAFGRQLDSCELPLEISGFHGQPFPAVFIRAPGITAVHSPQVEVLAEHEGLLAAVRYRSLLATSFHPELTQDDRFHQYFLEQVLSA